MSGEVGYLIRIAPDGRVTYKVLGIQGPACAGEAKKLNAVLGLRVEQDDPTSDYYAAEEAVEVSDGEKVGR